MVITGNGDDTAMGRGAGHVGVAEHIARTVNARSLAIPDAEDAIELAFAAHLRLLRAPQGGGGEILIEPGLELDVAGFKNRSCCHELIVHRANRRTAIAADIARRVEAGLPVTLRLHQHQAQNRLRSAQEQPGDRQVVKVRKTVRGFGHGLASIIPWQDAKPPPA